jgi:hypothetical protein
MRRDADAWLLRRQEYGGPAMLPTRNAVSMMPVSIRPEEDEGAYHAIAWLDHEEAHVIYFSAGLFDPRGGRPERWSRHVRASVGKACSPAAAKPQFYFAVAEACEDAKVVLVAGLSTAKTEFVKYLHRELPEAFDRICGIETMARMTDNQLVAEARRFFARTGDPRLS